jgi:phosphatidylinositol alpha 1,6-mannosyltransferase
MRDIPRVAFLADTFHEVNGAARTCREFAAFASRRGYPFFSVRFAGSELFDHNDPFWTLELKHSALSIGMDSDLRFDLLFYLQSERLEERLRRFKPDLIHVMSPGELGILGALAAHRMRIPLVAAWHTNVHEYVARRSPFRGSPIGNGVERFVLDQLMFLYGRGAALLAPSQELVDLLHSRSRKPVFLMRRGIDTVAFSPERRRRTDDALVIGYIGRLTPEKGVRFFATLEQYLADAGERGFRIYMAGQGSEAGWLRRNSRNCEFEGVLNPEALGRAYANMDLFVFPSRTDTFGNVVQEALASGVPAVVTDGGGPKTIVEHGVTGLVASTDEEMCSHVLRLMRNRAERKAMGAAGRDHMLTRSWDQVFEDVYRVYSICLNPEPKPPHPAPA